MSTGNAAYNRLRLDLKLIADWIAPGARVLDLGCGEGDLLYYLMTEKGARVTGIERNEEKVARCIARGITVLKGDINEEVKDYPDQGFDYVVLSQTLQQVFDPLFMIEALLRTGRQGIVSFPNFSHWQVRLKLLLSGHAPKTAQLPYEWYNTPNIRVLSLKDFERLSRQAGFRIVKQATIRIGGRGQGNRMVHRLPNLMATNGVFLIEKER